MEDGVIMQIVQKLLFFFSLNNVKFKHREKFLNKDNDGCLNDISVKLLDSGDNIGAREKMKLRKKRDPPLITGSSCGRSREGVKLKNSKEFVAQQNGTIRPV